MALNLVCFLGEDKHVTCNVIQKPIDTGIRRTGRRPDGKGSECAPSPPGFESPDSPGAQVVFFIK
jgi:hypothetical protein